MTKLVERKRKQKFDPNVNKNNNDEELDSSLQQEPKRKKSKKSKSLKVTVDGELSITHEEIKSKKRKKSNDLDDSQSNHIQNDFNDKDSAQNVEAKLKKTKKSKTLNVDLSVTPETKRRKKKKSKDLDSDNPVDSQSNLIQTDDFKNKESAQNVKVKHKKDKLNQSCESEIIFEISDGDIMLNTTNEPLKTTTTPKINKRLARNKFRNLRRISKQTTQAVHNGHRENGISESIQQEGFMVGAFTTQIDGENEIHEEGVVLRFKHAKFNKKTPAWVKGNDAAACFAKKSYKHLIRGDIILGFKNANLHQIDGYAITK